MTLFKWRNVAALTAIVVPALMLAQQGQIAGMTDYETHLVRGMAQRQQAQMAYDKVAVEKGSSEAVRNLAKLNLAAHTEGQTSITELGKSLNAWGAGGAGPGGAGPRVGGAPQGAGGPPQGAAPGGAAGGRQGGPPGGNFTPPGGGYDAELNTLTGPAFDRAYILVSLLQNEEMQRANALEIEADAQRTNSKLVAWSKTHMPIYRGVGRSLQLAARGELAADGVTPATDNPLNRVRGEADGPPRTGGAPAGAAAGARSN